MSFFQSVILGIVQGLTEFLPVSSSGHLVMMREIMDIQGAPLLYDLILHVATLVVVLGFFRVRILQILGALLRWAGRREPQSGDPADVRLAGVIILASIMTAGLGLVVRELNPHAAPRLAAALFLVTAALLIVAHFAGRRSGEAGSVDTPITARHGIIVGIVQGLAVFPGISRSGSTIAASLLSGVPRERAGEFAFLISVPAILGATLLEFLTADQLAAVVSPLAILAGFLSALIVGYLSLAMLVRLISGGKLWVFSIYLIPLGVWGLIAL